MTLIEDMSPEYKDSYNIDQITLLLIDQLLIKKQYTIEEIGEIIPVVIHSNSKKSQLTYINQPGCNYFNLSLNELLSMGNEYVERFVHLNTRDLNDAIINSHDSKSITKYLQPVTKKKDTIEWFISLKKLLSIDQEQTINLTYEW